MGAPGEPRHRAKRSLGQNFLVDANLQRKIVEALGATSHGEVVEIGPGQGALTRHLVGTVGRLVLVELDDGLAKALERQYGQRDDVDVVHGDILKVRLAEHLRRPEAARVVGNIPYNITTPILFRLLERPRPLDIILMVQEEVADRIVAVPGSSAYGALAVGVQSVARAQRLFRVSRGAFRPVPKVESAVVRITPLRPEPLSLPQEERLRVLVRAAFQWRRKQLGKILRDHPDLALGGPVAAEVAQDLGLDLSDRPERLDPATFIRLAERIAGAGGGP
ncbi:MAG TPA: 16S rRNA (adenine(1518)-N(6)/adenine(1519)-N(6))-dimethyltransferase RsmA [Longimicrobiales bacterium]|nr:16S rRNA (adenine(1518)-N(6)/adenine(1519)-N(6))-dimethyltransferase RsmA [Longimicrobiales bacterium]